MFRFQSFLLNPNGSWNSILKPDILNILGSRNRRGRVLLEARRRPERAATLWLLGPAAARRSRSRRCRASGGGRRCCTVRFEAYIRPVGNFGVFSIFPAVAYVFAGAFVGWLVWEHRDTRSGWLHRRLAIAAVRARRGRRLRSAPCTRLEVPTPIDSAPFFMWRTGAMILALRGVVGARSGSRRPSSWSPLVVFGQTSLFVYWIHVELGYGVFTYPIHHSLPLSVSFPAVCRVHPVASAGARGPLAAAWPRAVDSGAHARRAGLRAHGSGLGLERLTSRTPRTLTSRSPLHAVVAVVGALDPKATDRIEWAEADQRLVRDVAAGSTEALARLYDRHAGTVFGLARRILNRLEDAEEVVQDVFAQVWREAGRYERGRATVAGWVVMLARTRAIDRLRSRNARPDQRGADRP